MTALPTTPSPRTRGIIHGSSGQADIHDGRQRTDPRHHARRDPYVDFHTGARRLLTVDLTTGNAPVRAKYRPIASIDGRQYVVVWGPVSWEIPADRNVHVSVHLEGDYVAQTASLILPPGEGRVVLTYATDYMSGIGTLG